MGLNQYTLSEQSAPSHTAVCVWVRGVRACVFDELCAEPMRNMGHKAGTHASDTDIVLVVWGSQGSCKSVAGGLRSVELGEHYHTV